MDFNVTRLVDSLSISFFMQTFILSIVLIIGFLFMTKTINQGFDKLAESIKSQEVKCITLEKEISELKEEIEVSRD